MHHFNHRVPDDTRVIALDQPWQVHHWCRKFGVGEADLRLAMRDVGDLAEDVQRHLSRPLAEPGLHELWP